MKIFKFLKEYWGFVAILIIAFLYFVVFPQWICDQMQSRNYETNIYVTNHISQPEPTAAIEQPRIEDDEPLECCEMLHSSDINDIDAFKKNLRGLAPYADMFLQAEVQTGVNAKFLAAIAALESGWGSSDLAKYKNNLFGWTDENGYTGFGTKEECILMVADDLKEKYLSEDGEYFEGWRIEDVAKHYNTVNPAWSDKVREIMMMLGE